MWKHAVKLQSQSASQQRQLIGPRIEGAVSMSFLQNDEVLQIRGLKRTVLHRCTTGKYRFVPEAYNTENAQWYRYGESEPIGSFRFASAAVFAVSISTGWSRRWREEVYGSFGETRVAAFAGSG
jgi:hypothetical protein